MSINDTPKHMLLHAKALVPAISKGGVTFHKFSGQCTLLSVADIVTHIKGAWGNSPQVLESVQTYTKDQLEDHASDLLMLSVTHRMPTLTGALLAKGLRSGWALDAAVFNRDITAVHQLLDAGCTPCEHAELIAERMAETEIVKVISAKREQNTWFQFRAEF